MCETQIAKVLQMPMKIPIFTFKVTNFQSDNCTNFESVLSSCDSGDGLNKSQQADEKMT